MEAEREDGSGHRLRSVSQGDIPPLVNEDERSSLRNSRVANKSVV
jgi:hypothetical protein